VLYILRNDILTTIFWQLLDNFLSHTHMMLLSSLFLFLFPLFLTNKKWEKQGCQQSCYQMDVKISLLIYIMIWLIHVWCFQNHFLIVSWAVLNINILQVNWYMFLCYGIIGLSNYDLSIQIDWEESWWVLNPHVSCIWCFIILLPTHEPTFTSMFFPLLLKK
jgi:hypothetical protein